MMVSLGASGCSLGSTHTSTSAGKSLTLPWYGPASRLDRGILDPAQASPSTPLLLASIVNAGLVKFSPDLHVIPELAVSIPTVSTSGRTYTFTIRQDARFADGTHCTAADVAFSLARALGPREHSALAAQYLSGIEGAADVKSGKTATLSGVTVLHRLTVRIRLVAPDATFLQKLAFPVASIISMHGVGGLGPYRVARTHLRGEILFRPRPFYFNGPMHVSALQVVAVRNEATGLELYRKGHLDAAWISPDKMAAFAHRQDFHTSGSLDAYYAFPTSGDGVRLAQRLNREALVAAAGRGLSALQSIVPPSVPDYVSSPPSVTSGAPPSKLRLRIRISQPRNKSSQALRRALGQQFGTNRSSAHVVWIAHSTFLLPDPGRWMGILWQQVPQWYRARVLAANALTNDPVTRMSVYSDTENWLLSTGRLIPLASATQAWVLRANVSNVSVTPLGLMPNNDNWSLLGLD